MNDLALARAVLSGRVDMVKVKGGGVEVVSAFLASPIHLDTVGDGLGGLAIRCRHVSIKA